MIDLDAEMRFWIDTLALEQAGWKIKWGWVDSIPLGDGREAYGLNHLNADERTSTISIRQIRNQRDHAEFVDTCAHEAAHCWGAEIERRILDAHALEDDAAKEIMRTEVHEYIAENMARVMAAIKDTPREKAFAKALKTLSARTKAFAKAFAKAPPRTKGPIMMDPKQVAAALALIAAASTPEEKAKLLEEYKAQVDAMAAENVGEEPTAEPAMPEPEPEPMAAEEPPEEEKPPTTPAAKPLEEENGYMKAVDILLNARTDFDKTQREQARAYLKAHHKTLAGAAAYLKTIPMAKATQQPKAPAAKPLDQSAPQGGEKPGGVQLLAKADERMKIGALMGLPVNSGRGPRIETRGTGAGMHKVFISGNLTPKQWRAKKAAGWDPSKEFPMPGQEVA